jgi:hypothetical protein
MAALSFAEVTLGQGVEAMLLKRVDQDGVLSVRLG